MRHSKVVLHDDEVRAVKGNRAVQKRREKAEKLQDDYNRRPPARDYTPPKDEAE